MRVGLIRDGGVGAEPSADRGRRRVAAHKAVFCGPAARTGRRPRPRRDERRERCRGLWTRLVATGFVITATAAFGTAATRASRISCIQRSQMKSGARADLAGCSACVGWTLGLAFDNSCVEAVTPQATMPKQGVGGQPVNHAIGWFSTSCIRLEPPAGRMHEGNCAGRPVAAAFKSPALAARQTTRNPRREPQ